MSSISQIDGQADLSEGHAAVDVTRRLRSRRRKSARAAGQSWSCHIAIALVRDRTLIARAQNLLPLVAGERGQSVAVRGSPSPSNRRESLAAPSNAVAGNALDVQGCVIVSRHRPVETTGPIEMAQVASGRLATGHWAGG